MKNRNRLVNMSTAFVRIALALNGCLWGAIGLGLILSLVLGNRFTVLLLGLDTLSEVGNTTWGVRCLMLVGLLAFGSSQYIFFVLDRLVGSVAADDPFTEGNPGRIRRIAWALLAIQMLDLPMMAIRHYFPGLAHAVPDNGVSLSGWLAVLMLFILARVFTTGTSMRDYLRETV